jgi:hypothetical protein
MAGSADERVKALTGRMLRKKLFVVLATATGGPEGIRAHLAAHLFSDQSLELA